MADLERQLTTPITDIPYDPRSSLAGKAQQAFLHGGNLTGLGDALNLYMAHGPILEVYTEKRPNCALLD